MSSASERADGRACSPVLQSVFLVIVAHSASPEIDHMLEGQGGGRGVAGGGGGRGAEVV